MIFCLVVEMPFGLLGRGHRNNQMVNDLKRKAGAYTRGSIYTREHIHATTSAESSASATIVHTTEYRRQLSLVTSTCALG
jgi:hypothetical protein